MHVTQKMKIPVKRCRDEEYPKISTLAQRKRKMLCCAKLHHQELLNTSQNTLHITAPMTDSEHNIKNNTPATNRSIQLTFGSPRPTMRCRTKKASSARFKSKTECRKPQTYNMKSQYQTSGMKGHCKTRGGEVKAPPSSVFCLLSSTPD